MTIAVPSRPVAVTGASGELGRRVALRLASEGAAQRLVVRDAARAPSSAGEPIPGAEVAVAAGFRDQAGMEAAFRGVGTVFLVSAREEADRVTTHRAAIAAAVAAGVERIVYTSFVGAASDAVFTFARDHAATEEAIRASGLRHTFLRDNLYHLGLARMVGDDGVIRGPAGEGRVASVAHDDVADVATAVLLAADPGRHDGRAYDVTGPAPLTMAEVAEALSSAAGRRITYHAETVDEAYASRAGYAAPQVEVDGWVSSYTAIAAGELGVVSDAVETLAGRPAQSFVAWLGENPAAWAHLRGTGS
ncbi:NmrA family protein [Beutenbergia cavernae DSM 12333]|uniref:NmrA family protein n=1 Tax=Beutenbergia cavernae (strain ATCC BAA-8 / DSM 12333 / CCUG 43141 / JCM 11478 / NBRC 16432 / NCIMB 13614 / HKI 0122) TaxID=471853 RepID=C5BXP5_BEUC1|nr:NmrA family NAD(P)-binding protein [Beutenbergia cavernae]ACQ80928.1 NmrA family protein [Beutenbergia cavernae DSM 12333]